MVALTIAPTYDIIEKVKVKKKVRFHMETVETVTIDTDEPMAGVNDKLRLAASKGTNDKVLELIKSGASFEPDREGRTPLHYAASAGSLDVCRSLLQAGCHPSALDNMGYTSLHCAANQGHYQVAALLVEAGCHVDVQDDMHGNTALHEAAWNGYSELISLLIRHKCNVFVSNKSGFTSLHLAAQNGHNQSARILLYGISNPDARNNYGDTPLHTACRYGHAGVTRILISARCRINEQNKNGDSGLHIAAALKRRKIAKLLCEAGIDVNIRNKQNETASDVARRKDHSDVIEIINTHPRNPERSSSRSTSRGRRSNQSSRSKDDTRSKDSLSMSEQDDSKTKDEPSKKSKFSFFKKKKKEKVKEKENKDSRKNKRAPEQRPKRPIAPPSTQAMPTQPFMPTVGLMNQYVPRPGVQYYRDLAGNVKQGPVGYAPVCQCQPAYRRLAAHVEHDRYQLWEQLDVTKQEIQDRVGWLDQRQADQGAMVQDRLDLEELACFGRIEDRRKEERMHTRQILQEHELSVRHDLEDWTMERMESLERRVSVERHHDDADWTNRPHRSKLMLQNGGGQFVEGQGRLFRSRSDETLSVSEYNVKQRVEKEMAHQVALRELRDLRGGQQNTGRRRRERVPVKTRDPVITRDQFVDSSLEITRAAEIPSRGQSRDQLSHGQSRDQLSRDPISRVPSRDQMSRVPSRDPISRVPPRDPISRGPPRDPIGPPRDPLSRGPPCDPISRGPPRDPISRGPSRDPLLPDRTRDPSREVPDGRERKRTSPEGLPHRPLSFHQPGRHLADEYRRAQSEDELSPRKDQIYRDYNHNHSNQELLEPRDLHSDDVIIHHSQTEPSSQIPLTHGDVMDPQFVHVHKGLQQGRRYSEPAYAVPYNRTDAGSSAVLYRTEPNPMYNKTESGSNPDSGYSSRIYHTMLQQRQEGSPVLSSGSTGHNISNITTSSGRSRDSNTSQSNQTSSPGSCGSKPPPTYYHQPANYYHRVAQQVEQYYLRHNEPVPLATAPPTSGYHGNPSGHHGYDITSSGRRPDERVVATDV